MASEKDVQWVDGAAFPALKQAAEVSQRRRVNFNFHSGPADPVQRMLNVLCDDSYVTPHRHMTPPKSESFLCLEGVAGVLLFDDAGSITMARKLGGAGNPLGVDIPPGLWHAVLALSARAVLYEVKCGPYDPVKDKIMAPWAPAEGAAGCAALLEKMRRACLA